MTLEQQREKDAKQLSAWARGDARHPHGLSGHNWVIPYWESKDMRDAALVEYSEWGNMSGMVP
jgi:hypothetical protein